MIGGLETLFAQRPALTTRAIGAPGMADETYKVCSRCKLELSAGAFSPDRRSTDGLQSSCRDCANKAKREARKINPDDVRRAERARYQRNPDAKRIYAKAYAQLHPEKVVNNSRAWRRKHPEQRSAILKNYRALRRAITSEGMSAAALRAWTALQEKVCAWCGIECADNFHVDHVIPLSRGGPHEAENLTIACPRCNLRKNSKMPDDFRGAVA